MTVGLALRHAAAAALAAVAVVSSLVSPAQALEADPDAPVVVDDAIAIWPGDVKWIDVLENDTDPGGDELTVCWLPPTDMWEEPDPVSVTHAEYYYGRGTLRVDVGYRAQGVHVFEYSVCSHTHVSPARLTITFHDVEPVDVVRDDRPGRVLVTNHNTRPVKLVVYEKSGCRRDVIRWIAAGATTSVKVHYRTIAWIAGIASGVADLGRLSGIELAGKEGEPGSSGTCELSTTPYWDESWG